MTNEGQSIGQKRLRFFKTCLYFFNPTTLFITRLRFLQTDYAFYNRTISKIFIWGSRDWLFSGLE